MPSAKQINKEIKPATTAIPIPIKKSATFAKIKNNNPSISKEKITPGMRTNPKLVISQKAL